MDFTINFDANALTERIKQAALDGLQSAGEFVREVSAPEVPKDTGALLESARVEKEGDSVIVSYNTPYALKQHEELGYNHPNGGKAKYLEDPFNANQAEILEIIAERIRGAL